MNENVEAGVINLVQGCIKNNSCKKGGEIGYIGDLIATTFSVFAKA